MSICKHSCKVTTPAHTHITAELNACWSSILKGVACLLQVFYAMCQGLLYAFCYHLDSLLTDSNVEHGLDTTHLQKIHISDPVPAPAVQPHSSCMPPADIRNTLSQLLPCILRHRYAFAQALCCYKHHRGHVNNVQQAQPLGAVIVSILRLPTRRIPTLTYKQEQEAKKCLQRVPMCVHQAPLLKCLQASAWHNGLYAAGLQAQLVSLLCCRLSPLMVCAPSVAQQFLQQAERLKLMDCTGLHTTASAAHLQVSPCHTHASVSVDVAQCFTNQTMGLASYACTASCTPPPCLAA